MNIIENEETLILQLESGKQVVYDGISMSLYVADKIGSRLVECEKHVPEQIDNEQISADRSETVSFRKPRLSRVTINITDQCSLACKYCYASGGNYGIVRTYENESNLLDSFAVILSMFDVDSVMFFGGEASLRQDILIDCCLMMEVLLKQKQISSLPRLGVVSNLYGNKDNIDNFLALCKRFDIGITVSLDGPSSVHNLNRPIRGGGPSHETISANIELANKLNLLRGIECTFTRQHILQGITVVDLMKYFHEQFAFIETHIVPVISKPGQDPEMELLPLEEAVFFSEALEYSVRTLRDNPLYFAIGKGLLKAISDKAAIELYCPAGYSDLAISFDGTVYPCFMFVGNDTYNVGLATEKEGFAERLTNLISTFRPFQKKTTEECSHCWARSLCSGCIGSDFIIAADISSRTRCYFTKTLICEALLRLTEFSEGLPIGSLGYGHREFFFKQKGGGCR